VLPYHFCLPPKSMLFSSAHQPFKYQDCDPFTSIAQSPSQDFSKQLWTEMTQPKLAQVHTKVSNTPYWRQEDAKASSVWGLVGQAAPDSDGAEKRLPEQDHVLTLMSPQKIVLLNTRVEAVTLWKWGRSDSPLRSLPPLQASPSPSKQLIDPR
jgi:hypothetical protein